LSGVTDAYGKDSEHQQRLKDISRSIVCMLRTWSGMFIREVDLVLSQMIKYPGLLYFCMDDMRAIRSLIDTLRIPSLEPRVKAFSTAIFRKINSSHSGSYSGYVLRTSEYQNAGLVQSFHQWSTTYWYAIPSGYELCNILKMIPPSLPQVWPSFRTRW
jgi:hypothetical protein